MPNDYEFDDNDVPLAYLLTFRTYGTWLHGSSKYSVSDSHYTDYGGPKIPPNAPLEEAMRSRQRFPSVILDRNQRGMVTQAIREVCEFRKYGLIALNVRSNHAHAVVAASKNPDRVAGEFKAYATRALRSAYEYSRTQTIWTRGTSTRYLWKDRHVEAAINYVLYCQEDIPFDFQSE